MKYILVLLTSITCSNVNELKAASFKKAYIIKDTSLHVNTRCTGDMDNNCLDDDNYKFKSKAEVLYIKYHNDLKENVVCVVDLDKTSVPTDCDFNSNRLVYLRQLKAVEGKVNK